MRRRKPKLGGSRRKLSQALPTTANPPGMTLARVIPAAAGNTPPAPSCASGRTVHPRGCGEHRTTPQFSALPDGSSPRPRGTLGRQLRGQPGFRFMPAAAGNTSELWERRADEAVHPRGCGEHETRPLSIILHDGSSPRLRGTRERRGLRRAVRRFIPAAAGNTAVRFAKIHHRPVHPRGCGEHCSFVSILTSSLGSSPRLRGTHGHLADR